MIPPSSLETHDKGYITSLDPHGCSVYQTITFVRKVPLPNLSSPRFCLVRIRSMACPISQLITAETSSTRWLPARCYSCPSRLLFAHTESPLPFTLSYIDTVSSPSKQAGSSQTISLPNSIVTCSGFFFSRSIHVELGPEPKLPPSGRHNGWLVYFPPLASLPHSGGCLCTSREYWLCAIKGPYRPFYNNILRSISFIFLKKNVFPANILFAA